MQASAQSGVPEGEWKTAQIRVAASPLGTYDAPIRYKLSSGEIGIIYTDANGTQQTQRDVILADPNFQQLSINIISSTSGTLVLELPRSVIDSKMSDNSTDAPLTAFFRQDAIITPATVNELSKTEDTRIASIDFPVLKSDSAYNIGIQGTYVIPEFGSFAVLIVAVSIASVILGSRYVKRM